MNEPVSPIKGKEIEQVVAKPSKEASVQNANISHNTEKMVDSLVGKAQNKDNKLDKLTSTVEKASAIQTAMAAAALGGGKKMGNLPSLIKGKFDSLVSSKFSGAFNDVVKNKEKEDKEGGGAGGGASSGPGGKKEIDDLVNSVVNIVKKFDEIKDNVKGAKQVLGDVAELDFAKGLLKFVEQFNSKEMIDFTITETADYKQYASERDLINFHLSELKPAEGEGANNAEYFKKKAELEGRLGNLKEPPQTGAVRAQMATEALMSIFSGLSALDDVGLVSLAKLKSIERLDFAGTMLNFVKQFSSPDFAAFTSESTKTNNFKLFKAQENAEIKALKEGSPDYYVKKEGIMKKYSDRRDQLNLSPSAYAVMAVEGVTEIIESVGGIEKIGVASIMRLKVVNRLGIGRELGKLIRGISVGIKDVQTADFKGALESLGATVGAIDTFSTGFTKTIRQVVKIQALKPGYWMGKLFSSLNFDIPNEGKIKKEYGRLDESRKAGQLAKQLRLTTDPKAKADLRLQIAQAGAGVAQSTSEQFSRLVNAKLSGMNTVMDAMGKVQETAQKAVKSVMMAVPLVKIAVMGFGMMIGSIFSLIKLIDKLVEKNTTKGGLSLRSLLGLMKLKKPEDAPGETKASSQEFVSGQISKISSLVSMVNSFGGIWVDGLKSASVAMFVAAKLKFHENFPLIAAASYGAFELFKEIKVEDTNDFKVKFDNTINTIGKTLKDLGKASVFSKLALKSVNGFETIAKRISTVIQDMKKEKTSISAADGKMFEGIKTITDSLSGIGKVILSMALTAPLIPIAMVGLTFVFTSIMILTKLGQSKDVGKGTHATFAIANGIVGFILKMAFAGTLLLLLGPLVLAGLGFVFLVTKFFERLGDGKEQKHIHKGVAGLSMIALGIAFFALILVTTSLVLTMMLPKIMIGIGFVLVMVGLFFLMGKFIDKIAKGSMGLVMMSLSVAAFAIGLFILGRALPTMAHMASAAIGLMLMLGFVFVFSLIGERIADIGKGTLGIMAMSIGIAFFGIALAILSAVISKNKIDFGAMLLMLGLIAGFGVIFAVIGAAISFIAAGSLAVILMSAGLFSFGLAFEKIMTSGFDKMTPQSWDGMWNLVKLIGMLGTEFALVGVFSPFIIMGSAAVGLMGVALSSVVGGLKDAMTLDWKKIPIDSIKAVLVGLGEAFGAVGREGSKGFGILGAGLSLIGIGPNNVKRGIDAVLNASAALTEVAKGLVNFDKLTQNLDLRVKKNSEGQLEPESGSLLERISMSMAVVNKIFSDIGASGNTNHSYIGVIFGSDFKKSDTEVGINSVLNAGKALMAVGSGLNGFNMLTKDLDLRSEWNSSKKMYEPMKDSLPHKISVVLGVVNKIFSDIGASGNTNNSMIGMIFGSDFKKSDTEVGINSVMKAGDALISVAKGLIGFNDLTKDLDFDTSKDKNIGQNGGAPSSITGKIGMVLGVINKIFGDIGKNSDSNGIMGLIGFSTGSSDVEKGIKSIKGVSQEFVGIAQGLKVWGDLDKQQIDIVKISKNIGTVLSMIGKVFAEIGKNNSGGGLFGDGDVTKGIDAVKGISGEFKGVADGLKGFMELEKQGIKLDVLTKNITGVLTTVANVFAGIGTGSIDVDGKKVSFDHTAIKKGVDSVQGLGTELKGVSDSLKGFSDLKKNGIDLKTIGGNIKSVLVAIGDAFMEIGKTSGTTITNGLTTYSGTDAIKKGVESVKGLGSELSNISNGLKPFMDLQKNKIDIKKLGNNIRDILLVVANTFEDIGKGSGKQIKADSALMTGDSSKQVQEFTGSDAIKKGVESVTGLGSVLKDIGEMLKPFMDMQKSEKGQKPIDIKKIKTNIADIVSITANVFGALGGDTAAAARIKADTGVEMSKLDGLTIDTVLPLIKKAQEGLKIISDVSDLSNKVDPKKWAKIKDIVPAMAMMPVKIFTEMAGVYDIMKADQVGALVDEIIPKMVNRVNEIVTTQNNLSNQIKGQNKKDSPISSIGSDMKKFLNDISKPPSDQIMERVSKTVGFIERYSAVAPQFKNFQESYSKYTKDVKFLIDSVNKLQNTQFDKYIKLQEIVKDMISMSTAQVQGNVAAIINMLGQETTFLEKAAALTQEVNPDQQTITQTQEEYLNSMSQKSVNQMSQNELLSMLLVSIQDMNSKLSGKLMVKMS